TLAHAHTRHRHLALATTSGMCVAMGDGHLMRPQSDSENMNMLYLACLSLSLSLFPSLSLCPSLPSFFMTESCLSVPCRQTGLNRCAYTHTHTHTHCLLQASSFYAHHSLLTSLSPLTLCS